MLQIYFSHNKNFNKANAPQNYYIENYFWSEIYLRIFLKVCNIYLK